MLTTEDLDEIVERIEQRKRLLERIDGIEQQFTHTSDHDKVRLLLSKVCKIEEELREYGLMIDTIGNKN